MKYFQARFKLKNMYKLHTMLMGMLTACEPYIPKLTSDHMHPLVYLTVSERIEEKEDFRYY